MKKLLQLSEKIYDQLMKGSVARLEANDSIIIVKIDDDLNTAGKTGIDTAMANTIIIRIKSPSTKEKGVRTIAHELTHAIQFAKRGFRYPTIIERIVDEFEAYKATYEAAKIHGDKDAAEKALKVGSRYIASLIYKLVPSPGGA